MTCCVGIWCFHGYGHKKQTEFNEDPEEENSDFEFKHIGQKTRMDHEIHERNTGQKQQNAERVYQNAPGNEDITAREQTEGSEDLEHRDKEEHLGNENRDKEQRDPDPRIDHDIAPDNRLDRDIAEDDEITHREHNEEIDIEIVM